MLREILKRILAVLAKITINRYKPIVIGITGSVGKSSTKEAVFSVVSAKYSARRNEENYNNEIGVPAAILGVFFTGNLASKILNLAKCFWVAFGIKTERYPKVLILELAADKPGDINYLVNIAKPSIGVITAIGQVPVHTEFYENPKSVAAEKSKLIESLPKNGLAVIFHDDPVSLEIKDKSKAPVVTFGIDNRADFRSSDISYFLVDREAMSDGEKISKIGGVSFKINYQSSFIPIRLPGVVAPHLLNSVLASAAVGQHLGINLVDVAQSARKISFPKHRMQLVEGVKKSFVIDDTYNASPIAVQAALNVLDAFGKSTIKLNGKGKKIAVLGDMRELGKFEIPAHQEIGDLAGDKADFLVTVGKAAKFIADAAGNQIPKEKILTFENSEEAKGKVKEIIEEGDIILVKGSHSLKMEKIVEEIVVNYQSFHF